MQTSTSETYGTAQYVPIDENHSKHAQSPYAATKIAADEIALSYYRSFGTRVRVMRPFNTYGPRMIPNDGRVVSNFIVQALKGNSLTIYGDGSQTRSFCYIYDMVEGIYKLLHSNYTKPINLGNPEEIHWEI